MSFADLQDLDDLSDFEDNPSIMPLKRKRRRLRRKFSKKRRKFFNELRGTSTTFHEIRPSEVELNQRFKVSSPGDGVFCTVGGRHTIRLEGGWMVHMTRSTKLQTDYAVDHPTRKGYRFVPTHDSLLTGDMMFGWKVNHCCKNPTHKLYWEYDCEFPHPYLWPLRYVKEGEEFTFDYWIGGK